MRAVAGPDGRLTASECILSHFEEQHVNQDVARFAVKCGMWGVVKNMDNGFRKFQRDRDARHRAARAATEEARTREGREGRVAEGPSVGGVETRARLATGGVGLDASAVTARFSSRDEPHLRGGGGVRALTKKSLATVFSLVGKAAAASLAVGALVALEHRSRSVAESTGKEKATRRAQRIPRRGRRDSRGMSVTALDPGEVEAAVGKVLDERFAKLVDLTENLEAPRSDFSAGDSSRTRTSVEATEPDLSERA
jgi:hypothetical protein